MTSSTKPSSRRNLREAYERVYGCRTEHFQRDLLARSMSPGTRFLFLFLGWFRPHAFNPDWTLVEAIGGARTAAELEDRISEFEDLNRIDRSRRRTWLGIRASVPRLRIAVLPLLPEVESSEEAVASRGVDAPAKIEFATPRRVAEASRRSLPGTLPRQGRIRHEELEAEVVRLKKENERLLGLIAESAVEVAKLKAERR